MKKSVFKLFSLMLTLFALMFGADMSMAMAAAPGDNEPINRTADPDTKDLNTDLNGTPATEKSVKDSDINDDEIDDLVVRFRPFNYTFTTDIEKMARQKQVKDYSIKHPVMATPIMDCKNRAAYTASDADRLELVVGTGANANVSGAEARMFGKSQTFIVKGVPGYKWNGNTNIPEGDLMLKVVGRSSSGIVAIPVNGFFDGTKQIVHNDIPMDAMFQMLSTAGHTAQLIVSPKNSTPTFVDANLQKKIMNTTIEKEWKIKKKNVPYFTDDIADNAMMQFRQENERTKLVGAGGMLVEEDPVLGQLNCYYEEGVIPQLLMKYVTDGAMTYKDFIALARMQFGKWSASNEAEMYCSYGKIEEMLNLDFTKVAQTNVLATQNEFGVDITKFKTTFGTFNIKLCPILDEMGFENCAMIIDMKNGIHYWKKANVGDKSKEDLSKGGQEPVEADRDRYIKIDCFCLRGYNSILVGPADKIYGIETVYSNRKDIRNFYSNVNGTYFSLNPNAAGNGQEGSPKAWVGSELAELNDDNEKKAYSGYADGMLVYLVDDDDYKGYTAGSILYWDAAKADWFKFKGALTA